MNKCWRLCDPDAPRKTVAVRYEVIDPAVDDHIRFRGYEPTGEVICGERKIRLARIYQFDRRQPWLEELGGFELLKD